MPDPTVPAGHPSGSLEQRDAEPLILAAVAASCSVALAPRRLGLTGESAVDVDGVNDEPPVRVEV